MGLVWNAWSLVGLLVLPLAWFLAGLVYAAGPRRGVNRLLAITLFLDGVWYGGIAAFFLTDSAATVHGLSAVVEVAFVVLPWAYLAFLGRALETPLARPFRTRAGEAVLLAGALGSLAWFFADTPFFIAAVAPEHLGHGQWWPVWGVGDGYFAIFVSLAFFYGLAASLDAYRRAPKGTIGRQKARAFTLAFGTRDLYVGLLFVFYNGFFVGLGGEIRTNATETGFYLFNVVRPAVLLVYLVLLGYGILRTQLFDIDVKLKWTIRKGTVAGAFVAVFFIASQVAENVLQLQFGTVFGAIAAGLLLFALAPLQRLAERVANMALPSVAATSEYLTFRKFEVYKESLETLLRDGVITPKEQDLLANLRAKLGIADADARTLEAEVRRTLAPVTVGAP